MFILLEKTCHVHTFKDKKHMAIIFLYSLKMNSFIRKCYSFEKITNQIYNSAES